MVEEGDEYDTSRPLPLTKRFLDDLGRTRDVIGKAVRHTMENLQEKFPAMIEHTNASYAQPSYYERTGSTDGIVASTGIVTQSHLLRELCITLNDLDDILAEVVKPHPNAAKQNEALSRLIDTIGKNVVDDIGGEFSIKNTMIRHHSMLSELGIDLPKYAMAR